MTPWTPPRRGMPARALIATALTAALSATLYGCGGDDPAPTAAAPTPAAVQLQTLSSPADLTTGGNVLAEITVPADMDPAKLKVQLNGADVTARFQATAAGARTLRGLVNGLVTSPAAGASGGGSNKLLAFNADLPAQKGELAITSFPVTGPVLSGPQQQWECRTVESGLGAPLDANCTGTTRYSYYYRSTGNTFKTLADPGGVRPVDLATTVTNAGKTVPYIVRIESGTNNRSIYRIAALDNPTADSVAGQKWKGETAWNNKAVMSFGGGCGNQYNQGVNSESEVLNNGALSLGFAFMTSSGLTNQMHCNPHLQGETAMMLKEYFTKQYGIPKWVAGTGGSGGAIQQYLIAQLYPGLLDGIQPSVPFPDAMMEDVVACSLLKQRIYAVDPVTWTTAKQTAVDGYSVGTCSSWHDLYNFTGLIDAIKGITAPALAAYGANVPCGLIDQTRKYNPATNPTGVRCDVFTGNINALGRNSSGIARRPYDNVGVQYGLAALNAGSISTTEFLDLNDHIGGFDADGQPAAARSVADPEGIRAAYQTGLKNTFGGGLATTPIVHLRNNGSTIGDIHHRYNDFIIRERLRQANGRVDNQVILTASGANAVAAGVDLQALSLDMMNRWLDALKADAAPLTADKVARNRPADATDTCWVAGGAKLVGEARMGANACNTAYPVYGSPSTVAGAPANADLFKCQLKPVNAADYGVTFTGPELARLNTIFPGGVCDYTKRDANLQALRGTYLRLPLN